jgi:chromosome segregation ATPase
MALETVLAQTVADVSVRVQVENSLREQLAASQAALDRHIETTAALREQLASGEAERRSQLETIEQVTARAQSAEEQAVALRDATMNLASEIAARTADIELLRSQLAHTLSRVADLERSLSWRVTYPLRRGADLLTNRRRG